MGAKNLLDSSVKPRTNTTIQFCWNNDITAQAKVVSKQLKKSGANVEWITVHVDGQARSSSIR